MPRDRHPGTGTSSSRTSVPSHIGPTGSGRSRIQSDRQADFQANPQNYKNFQGGHGSNVITQKGHQIAGAVTTGVGYLTGIEPLKWAGRLFGVGGKKKTEKEKSIAYTKKGYDISNPNEMKAATKRHQPILGGDGDGAYVTPITLAAASTPKTPPISQRWNFQAYEPTSTAHTRLYGKTGKMVKANQGEFSKGKRFGPPPKKGPDPQGLNVPLNSVNYFKDLL